MKRNPAPWVVGEVTRPNAGAPLYNAVRWVNGRRIESGTTPTHSRKLAQQHADELNRKAGS